MKRETLHTAENYKNKEIIRRRENEKNNSAGG
jgi:hypothetical protein